LAVPIIGAIYGERREACTPYAASALSRAEGIVTEDLLKSVHVTSPLVPEGRQGE